MSCVAQSTPMIAGSFGLLRRRALKQWLTMRLASLRSLLSSAA